MRRLDRGLELEPPEGRAECVGTPHERLSFGDERAVPQRGVLFVERWPRRACSGGRPRLREREQRGKAPCLRLGVEQARGEHGQPPRLVCDRLAYAFVLIEPVDCIRAVDGLEHSGQPGRQIPTRRHLERDTRVADAALRPDQALRHRCWLDREHASDAVGVEAEHDLEHERGPNRGVDSRVRAREQQFEALVGDRIGARIGTFERGGDANVQRRGGAHGC